MSMNRTHVFALALLIVAGVGSDRDAGAASHHVKPGDPLPEFSVQDLSGNTYAYNRQEKKALMIMFLSADQTRSVKAQTDLARTLSELDESLAKAMVVVIALNDPNAFPALTGLKGQFSGQMIVTLDQGHHLWGRFGVIAMPTVVIADKQGKVVRYEAGYGYNFAPVIRSHVNQVLGVDSNDLTSTDQVTTVANSTADAKLGRLLSAAHMMADRGHFDAAIIEIKKAIELDPNALDAKLVLAELYCKTLKGEEALVSLQDVTGRTRSQKAKISLISGWAFRLTGRVDEALDALVIATSLAPRDARAFYELGRAYELKGLKDEALKAYRHALDLLF